MKFIDKGHKDFWNETFKEMQKLGKTDVYYKSLVYALGICEVTRQHFKQIFNLEKGEINIDSLSEYWQTSTSAKTTRLAFSLWNRCMYDSTKDIDKKNYSPMYNLSDIFCCSYAPYYYEAVKIRYPEYTREMKNENFLDEEMEE